MARLHGRSLHLSALLYVSLMSIGLLLLGAVAMLHAERGMRGANVQTFGDALWWAATTVTTVGYGDRYPTTTTGRLVGAGLMLVGVALIGVVTASVAAWFLERLRNVQEVEERTAVTLEEVLEELRSLRAQVAELSRDRVT